MLTAIELIGFKSFAHRTKLESPDHPLGSTEVTLTADIAFFSEHRTMVA